MSTSRRPISRILGVGCHFPPRVVTNADLATKFEIDTSDEWIQQRSGIKERRFVDAGIVNADLGAEAARKALEAAGVRKEEIDLIVYATVSPDYEFPGMGCFLQAKLGLPGIPAIDVRNACTGFLYGLGAAEGFIATGRYKHILVVGSEIHSRGMDLSTRGRDVAVLFGDGAGAAVVGASDADDGRGILSVHLHADGEYARELWVEAPGSAHHPARITKEMIDSGAIYPRMNGRNVFVNAVRRMPEVLLEALKLNGLSIDQLDLLVPHQANLRISEAVGKALGLPDSKVFNTIEKYGNTTAATIPIGLAEAVAQGKLKPGMLVGLAAFGSGFTWGAALVRW